MLLHVALFMLVNSKSCQSNRDEAKKLLNKFVGKLTQYYEESAVSYTMHSLVHVCDDVARYGALDEYSAFLFESALGAIKKLFKNGKMPLQQVCWRLSEFGMAAYLFHKRVSYQAQFAEPHYGGPCLGCEGTQYKKVEYGKFAYAVGGCNSYVMLDSSKLATTHNVIDSVSDGIVCIGRLFATRQSFYSYLCDSLRVYSHSAVRKPYHFYTLSDY